MTATYGWMQVTWKAHGVTPKMDAEVLVGQSIDGWIVLSRTQNKSAYEIGKRGLAIGMSGEIFLDRHPKGSSAIDDDDDELLSFLLGICTNFLKIC